MTFTPLTPLTSRSSEPSPAKIPTTTSGRIAAPVLRTARGALDRHGGEGIGQQSRDGRPARTGRDFGKFRRGILSLSSEILGLHRHRDPGRAQLSHARQQRAPRRASIFLRSPPHRVPVFLARRALGWREAAVERVDMDVIGKNAHAQRRAIGCESRLDAHWQKDERHGGIGVAGIEPQRSTPRSSDVASFLIKALEVSRVALAGS